MRKFAKFLRLLIFLSVALPIQTFAQSSRSGDIREGSNAQPGSDAPRHIEDEFIVKFRPGVPADAIERLNAQVDVKIKEFHGRGAFHVLKVPPGRNLADLIEFYGRHPLVEYAEPHFVRRIFFNPNDQYYFLQWHLHGGFGGIRMPETWDLNLGGSPNITVAVIDTGIGPAPDLADTGFVPGYDFVNNDNDPNDDHSHGTHVAGTVAQSTDNGFGVAGVAFKTKLMPIKVCDASGNCPDAAISDGIRFAADNGAKVINLSLGGPDAAQTIRDAVSYAYSRGVTIVAAAGNDNQPQVSYPAALKPYVIAIGSTKYDAKRSSFSNYGTGLDLMAPGGECSEDLNRDGYGDGVLQQTFDQLWYLFFGIYDWAYYFYCGTSMATPHAAGAAALVLATDPSLTPDQVRATLQESAKPLGQATQNCETKDFEYGCGLLDAYAAVQKAREGGGPDLPALSISDAAVSEGDSGTTSALFTVSLSAASNETVTVEYATSDNTATAGSDYQSTSGVVSFNPGETSRTVAVAVIGDTNHEPNEEFFVALSNPSNARLLDGQGVGTITDDDAPPASSITVLSPDGGELWTLGSNSLIVWSSNGINGNVRIQLSRNGGSSWKTLFSSTPNDGAETWKVNRPATNQARIRVCGVNAPNVCDISNGTFTIK